MSKRLIWVAANEHLSTKRTWLDSAEGWFAHCTSRLFQVKRVLVGPLSSRKKLKETAEMHLFATLVKP